MAGTPNTTLATLRPDLQGALKVFDLEMSRNGFIGQLVFPKIEVATQAGSFGKIDINAMLQQRKTQRTSRGGYSRQDYEFTSDNYATQEHGTEEKVDSRDKNIYANYFDMELIAAQRARDAVLRNFEMRVVAAVFNTTTYTGSPLTTAVGTSWSTVASATPVADVKGAKVKVYDNCGMTANTLIITYHAFMNLQQNQAIIDRVKYSGNVDVTTRGITRAALAQAFDVEQVLVANAQYNTSNEGQNAGLAPIWGDAYAMVCHVAETNDIQEPCIGRTFHWGGDGSVFGGSMETYRDETVRADIVRCRMETQEKSLVPICGHLLSNIG